MILKNIAAQVANPILDLFFPPLCRLCKNESRRMLCTTCIDLLTLIDPMYRCRHCFAALENVHRLCTRCSRSSLLAAPRAFLFELTYIARRLQSRLEQQRRDTSLYLWIASLLIVQWGRLDWPLPDKIAIVPRRTGGAALYELVQEVCLMFERPFSEELRLYWTAPFKWSLQRKKQDLLENQQILLLDTGSSLSTLRQALNELWPAFPAGIHILSLFEENE